MARCKNDTLISKIGLKALTKMIEVDFAVLTDVDSCVKVNTKNFIDQIGTSATFNSYSSPEDLFNCLAEGCRNTGTLIVSNGAGLPVGALFSVLADATDFVAGVITYYVNLPKAGSYNLKTTIMDVHDSKLTNGDVYENIVTATDAGFYPVVVDLSKAPSKIEGNGWDATEAGVVLKLEVTSEDETLIPTIGFSSISIYDSLEEFEVNDVVKIGCIDEFSGEITVDPVDASCFGGGYDPTSIAIERTLSGKSATPNYWKLNPLMSKGDQTTGWIVQTVERPVTPVTIGGVDYGYVQLADMNMEECSFTTAAISDECNVTDATLNRVSSPVVLDINEKQFIVLDGTTTTLADAGKVLFHGSLVGKKVVISYPKKVDVEHFIGSEDALDERKVRMSFTQEQTDGVKQVYVYNNVLITSFPGTVNNEETTFEFTISIQRDKNGRFYDLFRVID